MKKGLAWLWDNILFIETIFLLVFIPLFPKIPILDVRNTWVYIRAEDFIVFFVLISWLILLIKNKVTLRTPITFPILIFWIIGLIATVHGVLIIFPEIANAYPNVAFLSLLRHIEYMSIFFIAFAGIRDKNQLKWVIAALFVTLLGVILYGFGQKFLGFPAYLTMNEEFAKGIPIKLSELSRVPSTFAGHYDLAAYLVLIIPIMASLFFGVKNYIAKASFVVISFLGLILLFMTVSRVSFAVLFIALFAVLFFQKRKLALLAIPLGILMIVGLLTFQSSLTDRFKSTVSEVDVLVDAKTGDSLGHVRFVNKEELKDKVVLQRRVKDKTELEVALSGEDPNAYSTTSAILPFKYIPEEVPLVTAVNISTGESLSQGTGYTNLYLSPVVKRLGNFYYELPPDFKASPSAQILVLHGDFIVKRASAYDLSFTTRFQGEWPNAIQAFKRNLLVGSGYGSVSLAVDNNYLRILGEIGVLGFVSFLLIFISLGIYIRKVFSDIDSILVRSYIIGFGAGLIGLALNATLIDVFEASKIAFLLWTLTGVTFGILVFYQKKSFSLKDELIRVATSSYAILIYLFLFTFVIFVPTLGNNFVGDDFTWLRWVADCKNACGPVHSLSNYLINADGFFYRPGTKAYFYFMYNSFWLNQVVYHLVSLVLHFVVAALFYLLARKILKNNLLATIAAFLFVIMSGSAEAVLWVSSTGYLFNAVFGLIGLLSFIYWDEKKKIYWLIISIVSFSAAMLFHELGVVLPFLVPVYLWYKDFSIKGLKNIVKRWDVLILLVPMILYILLRFIAGSHWFNGDYSYDPLMLPFNFIGNSIGYLMLSTVGSMSLSIYESIRMVARQNILAMLVIIPIFVAGVYLAIRYGKKYITNEEKKTIVFGILFFIVALLPFIALGNITSRYSYMAAMGIILILMLIVKRLYEYLSKSGKEIGLAILAIAIGVFALFQIIQVQQTYFEWREAGNKAKNFFIGFDSLYETGWSDPSAEFHFVNVPLKVGDAWVFPVGLNDAVWFAFKNDKAKIFIHPDLQSALDQAGYSKSKHVLRFTDSGTVVEVDRFRNVDPDLITP